MTPRKSGLVGAALCGGFGLFFLFSARHAQVHHTLLRGYHGGGWVTPNQAYLAAFLFLALAAYAIYLGFLRDD